MAELNYECKSLVSTFFTKEKMIVIPTDLLTKAFFSVTSQNGKSFLKIKSGSTSVTLDIPNTSTDVIRDIIRKFFEELNTK